MKRSIDLQSSHHNTRPEYLSTKIEVAIKKDNELYREVKLAIRDAKESEHEYEEDINGQNLRIIKNDQQEALEEFVQTCDKSTVPPGVLQRYQEERAICEAMLAEIAEEEERVMDKGGYGAEDTAIRTATGLGYAPLTGAGATKQTNKMYEKTRLGKDVQQRRQIVEDRIGEINAELAYYMGLAEPPLAVLYPRRRQFVSGAKKRLRKHNRPTMRASPGILMFSLMMTKHHAQATSWDMVAALHQSLSKKTPASG